MVQVLISVNHGYTYSAPDTAPLFTFYEPREPPRIARLLPAYGRLGGGPPNTVTVLGHNFAPTGRALACRFGAHEVTAEFVNVSAVRCVPPAAARAVTVPFSVTHAYDPYGDNGPPGRSKCRPLATRAPQLSFAPCASSARAWRLWAARHSQSEAQPPGAPPRSQLLERTAHFSAFDRPGPPGWPLPPLSIDPQTGHAVPGLGLAHVGAGRLALNWGGRPLPQP